jgi:hypothetical protein
VAFRDAEPLRAEGTCRKMFRPDKIHTRQLEQHGESRRRLAKVLTEFLRPCIRVHDLCSPIPFRRHEHRPQKRQEMQFVLRPFSGVRERVKQS